MTMDASLRYILLILAWYFSWPYDAGLLHRLFKSEWLPKMSWNCLEHQVLPLFDIFINICAAVKLNIILYIVSLHDNHNQIGYIYSHNT